ncbi:MAG TPA: Clp protease N-terminal domain-containing protein [Pyrinomonadaceae bacterium]|jgi:transcription antitermination factor NusG|nr:Clp protease N-terminal domain-containing protein [Pyrinomonadaceae bacterium]
MEDPKTFRERFAEGGWRVLERAIADARRHQLDYVSLEHLIGALGFAEANLFDAIMLDSGVDAREMRALLETRSKCGLQHRGGGVRLAPEVNDYLKRAWRRVRVSRRQGIEATDIFVALAEDKRGLFVEMLRSFGADVDRVAFTVHRRAVGAEVARLGELGVLFAPLDRRAKEQRFDYAAGDTVRIKSGPFASFPGEVREVFKEAAKLKVIVNIFGNAAAVELRYIDVEKLNLAEGR